MVIFKQRHTSASSRGQLASGVRRSGPGQLEPAGDGPGREAAAPPGQASPQTRFVAAPGRDRVIHSHTSPPKTCMFSELAGRRRKLGAPCPLRGAAPPPRRAGRRGSQPAPLTLPVAVTRPPAPDSLWLRPSSPRATRRGEGAPSGTRAPRAPGRGRGRRPGAGIRADAHP